MERARADDASSDVAVDGLRSVSNPRPASDTLYRRPPARLPEPTTPPVEGTTVSQWFSGRPEAETRRAAVGRGDSSSSAAPGFDTGSHPSYPTAGRPPAPAETPPAPRYGPTPPVTAGRASFGFGPGPISPSRPPGDPTSAAFPSASSPSSPSSPEATSGGWPAASWPPPVRMAAATPSPAQFPGPTPPAPSPTANPAYRDSGTWRTFAAPVATPHSGPVTTVPDLPPRQSQLVTIGVVALSAVVLLAGTVVGVVYFSGSDQSISSILQSDASSPGKRAVTAPLDNRTTATFEQLAATSSVHVTIGELGDDLYRISTPDDAGIKPSPVIRGDDVQLQVTRDGDGTGGEVDVVLAAEVQWSLKFAGSSEEQYIDLSGGQVTDIAMLAGMSRAELSLPEPSGTVPVTITGAVGNLTVRSPSGNPIRIKVSGGAKRVVAGSRNWHDMPAGATLTPRDWAVPNRYDIRTASQIGSLTVESFPSTS